VQQVKDGIAQVGTLVVAGRQVDEVLLGRLGAVERTLLHASGLTEAGGLGGRGRQGGKGRNRGTGGRGRERRGGGRDLAGGAGGQHETTQHHRCNLLCLTGHHPSHYTRLVIGA